MNQLVSIVTPCFNGEKYINQYFNSILNQTYPNIEIIIVNDGSTDNTEQLILSYQNIIKEKGYILKYIKQPNGGPGVAMNTGIKEITRKYITWIDIDDYYSVDAIENLVNYLELNPDYKIVRGLVKFINTETGEERIKGPNDRNKEFLFEDYLLVKEDCYCFSGIWMVRTSYFDERIKNREIYKSKFGQGWQLTLPLLLNNKCKFVNKVVLNCLVHEDSHSHQTKTIKEMLIMNNGYEDILLNVIPTLDMEKEEREHYIKIIKNKYLKERINIRTIKRIKRILKMIIPKKIINVLKKENK